MSGKLSIYDAFITVGAFILVLGLYQHVKPLLSARAYAGKRTISCDEFCFMNPVGEKCRVCRLKAQAIIGQNAMQGLGLDLQLQTMPPAGRKPGSDQLLPTRGYNEVCEYDRNNKPIWCKRYRIPGNILEYPDLREDETHFRVGRSPEQSDKDAKDIANEYSPQAAFARAYAGFDNFLKGHQARPINCDKPLPWTRTEIQRTEKMSPEDVYQYVQERERNFKDFCRQIARSYNERIFEDADPEQKGLKMGTRYPVATPPYNATFSPQLRDYDIGNQAAFARAYAVDEDEQPIPVVNASRYDPPTNYTNNPSRPRPIAYKDCVRGGGHPKCCDAALHGGITQDEFDNCHLCNHPDCSGAQFDTSRNTAAGIKDNPVDAGFQLGKWTVPIQDIGYKSNMAQAYRVTYV
jgi:hypothetical protein